MYCPHCGNQLDGRIDRSCGSCSKDIQFLAPALLDGGAQLSGEMTETALFQKHDSEGQATEDVEELEPGDLVEVFRDTYQHWAVYVGDGYIVHLVALDSVGASSTVAGGSVKGQVKKDKLIGNNWKKNNTVHPTHDNKLKPKPNQEIVKEALSWVGKDMEYSLPKCNCEHFATMCRYGKAVSLQVRKATKTAAVIGSGLIGSFVGSVAATSSMHYTS